MSFSDLEQQKSFEFFRGNSKSIQIITFDELLMKLRQLHTFLSGENSKEKELPQAQSQIDPEDLPF